MEIHWTRHAIHRCWERMLLDDDEKNMGIFDKGLCIPFKVKNQKYYVSVKKEKGYLVIVTMFHLNRTGWLTEALLDN